MKKMQKETLYKYFEGIASPEEEAAVYRWLDASSENEEELLKEREFFDAMILAGSADEKAAGERSWHWMRTEDRLFVPGCAKY